MILHDLKVDEFCPETNEFFEFQGCYYHGCPKCYKFGRNEPLLEAPKETLNFRYEVTMAKTEELKRFGYQVNEKWECKFRREIQANPNIKYHTKNHPLLVSTPLNPRDAFYGGRTGNIWEYYETNNDEKINIMLTCALCTHMYASMESFL